MISFMDAIQDKKLSELDLAYLDHAWTLERITQLAEGSEANVLAGNFPEVAYGVIDYGGLQGGIFPYDTLFPAISVRSIIGQICKETSYKPVGKWLDDELYLRLYLPFTEGKPKAHDKDWIDDRTARVSSSKETGIAFRNGHPINVILPLNLDNDLNNATRNGKLKPYKVDGYRYVCLGRMRVNVMASVSHTGIILQGAPEVKLILERNGVEVASTYWSEGGYKDYILAPQTISLETTVECHDQDDLVLRLTGSARTTIASYSIVFDRSPDAMYASFMPDASIHLGDIWPVAANLPDMTCKDLVMSLAKFMCGKPNVDDVRKTVEMVPLDDVVENLPHARDWSECVDELVEPQLDVQIEPYGKRNWLKWKEQEERTNIGFGDGYIESPVVVSPVESTLFELPFSACLVSDKLVGGYGNPVLIKSRKVSGVGETLDINDEPVNPRMLLFEPTKVITAKTNIIDTYGTVVEVPVKLTPCWWGARPDGAKTLDNAYSLAFDPVTLQFAEESLINRYFSALKRTLRRPRMLTVSVYLQPADIAFLNLSIPIRLQNVRIASLDINDQYFYLNKLASYRSGLACKATLIAV